MPCAVVERGVQIGLAGAQRLAGPQDHRATGHDERRVVGEHRVGQVVDDPSSSRRETTRSRRRSPPRSSAKASYCAISAVGVDRLGVVPAFVIGGAGSHRDDASPTRRSVPTVDAPNATPTAARCSGSLTRCPAPVRGRQVAGEQPHRVGTGDRRAELAVQVGHAHLVNELGVVVDAVGSDAVGRRAPVVRRGRCRSRDCPPSASWSRHTCS